MKKNNPRTEMRAALGRVVDMLATGTLDLQAYVKARDQWTKAYNRKLAQPISGRVEVVGVYPVKAAEPVHLVELLMRGIGPGFSFGSISQAIRGAAETRKQVPRREVLLDSRGEKVVVRTTELSHRPEKLIGDCRVAFFIHYLDLKRPLKSPFGDISLPKPVPRPKRLRAVRYQQPD